MWALFWALAKAEHEFLYRFVPFWSHEERLTGHFLSQILERIAEFSSPWHILATTGVKSEDSHLRVWYADIATHRQESVTGADMGLVVHAKFKGHEEFLKVMRLQAKKVSPTGRATIDLDQTATLLTRNGLGYYLFYHARDKEQWHRAPTVSAASRYDNHVQERQKLQPPRRSLGTVTVDVKEDGYDFASFVTFAFSDPTSEHGVIAQSPQEAVSVLTTGNIAGGPPTRVLVITMGSQVPPTDWPHLFGEYLAQPFEDQ